MSETPPTTTAGPETVDNRTSIRRQVMLALDLWKIWAVGLVFLVLAWIASGIDGLMFVVEPFYLLFALLSFGYGVRRLRERIEQSYL